MLFLLALGPVVPADDIAVDYSRDVKVLFREHCYACHGTLKQEGGLRLDTGSLARTGGDSGAVIIPGDAGHSRLIERISATDESVRMPPEGEPLTADQIRVLASWIQSGAVSPKNEQPEQDPKKHWAFQKPVRPEVPVDRDSAVSESTTVNPIDAFINAQRRSNGIAAMPPTDKATLLRRVCLDLKGLPPTADELQAFQANDSQTAYEQAVDRLLASPQYGERWGRHWMDVWRYSDWYGRRSVPDVMNSYPMVWRWRDWIVQSINEDKPYNQMIVEMLAADELLPADDQNIVATGYLVRSWFKWNYETWKKDLVEHTGKAFLGLTLNCCQCHDHKYDPISQEEYFRFRAFFEPLELRQDRVPGDADPGPFQKYVYAKSYGPISSGMIRVFDEYLDAETFMFSKGDSRLRIEGKPSMTPAAPAVTGGDRLQISQIVLPLTAAYPGMKEFVREEERSKPQAAMTAAQAELAAAKAALSAEPAVVRDELTAAEARLAAAQMELASVQKRIEADSTRYSTGLLSEDRQAEPEVKALIHAACQSERAAAMATAKAGLATADQAIASAEVKIAAGSKQSDQAAMEAANKALQMAQQQRATAVTALDVANANLSKELGEYTPLSPKYPQVTSGRRAMLAKWIASRDNPLTARVAVNHIWLRHFGQALVDTTYDFGLNGSRPTHRELLDWLACELMDSGWSIKHLHRLIVTSQTYRLASMLPQSSGQGSEQFALANSLDPDNKLYWRFPASRMQAEVVRDSLLAVAGELNETVGGHEIDHTQGMTSHRRSLYFAHHGEEKMEFLELFDAANACDCYKRTSSVQPQQALALTNSELTKTLSRQLATKLWSKVTAEASPRLTRANGEATASVEGITPTAESVDTPSDSFVNRFVRLAFLQVLNREPREQELAASLSFLAQQATRLAPTDGTAATVDPAERSRENLIHALMNHNDFVTVR